MQVYIRRTTSTYKGSWLNLSSSRGRRCCGGSDRCKESVSQSANVHILGVRVVVKMQDVVCVFTHHRRTDAGVKLFHLCTRQ